MKCVILCTLLGLATAASPVDKVVTLIEGLKTTTEADGASELKAYDKYACWCEDTMGSKASDIANAKTQIEELGTSITKLGGELASYSVDIKQLTKDVAANKASQKEATEMRTKEFKSYDEEKTEGEQCIGALEAAIKVLTGAGGGKTKFLETLQQAKLLSSVGALRGVLGNSLVRKTVSESNMDMVRKFIDSPDDYLPKPAAALVQKTGNNPFGDYAPQSSAIQGILKGMYDSFTSDLEKSNAEESTKQKAFEALMETKVAEGKTLSATLQRSEGESASKTKELADSKSTRDDTKEQLEADETFFALTKGSCKSKAQQWAMRTRLRAEELQGMMTAVSILSSDEAKATFKGATTTFLQLKSMRNADVYAHMRKLAEQFPGLGMAQIAAEVNMAEGGHFDKIIHTIQNMVLKLKAEAKDDIEHRDRCETKQDTNKKAMEDLDFNIDKLKDKLGRMKDQETSLNAKIKTLSGEIDTSDASIKAMNKQRKDEWDDFSQATKDDVEAVNLIGQAIASLSKFYADNNIKQTALVQADPEKAPEVFEDGAYGGKKSGSTGIIAILSMIKEDLENELKAGKQGDAASQINFKNDRQALQDSMDAQMASKADADKALAEVERQINFRDEDKTDLKADLDGEDKIKDALEKDCDWIKSDFQKRVDKRKLEIEGLNEAAQFLAGAVVLPR